VGGPTGNQVALCLESFLGDQQDESSVHEFFNEWFGTKGSIHFFLFKKNLRVTNIQIAELVALLRTHVTTGTADSTAIQFLTVSEFKNSVRRLIETLGTTAGTALDEYAGLLERVVVLEPRFGSCTVYAPPTLSFNVALICRESGYIHSCGECIFVRNVYKTEPEEFFRDIDAYFARNSALTKPLLFRVYAHEDFTRSDRSLKTELRHGLDDVKVFVEKFYMGSKTLLQTLRELATRYAGKLVIAEGDYKNDELLRSSSNVDVDRTLWLVVDHDIGEIGKHPGDRHFFICYEQTFINESPFHITDENKPAWMDHTTIPQTLIAAMLNITRPYWPNRNPVCICDPFVGSGTTLVEALKYQDVHFWGFDFEHFAPLLCEDNVSFFARSKAELEALNNHLGLLLSYDGQSEVPHNPAFAAREWASDYYQQVPKDSETGTVELRAHEVAFLRSRPFLDRVVFYLVLKTKRRKISANSSATFHAAFNEQVWEFTSQLKRLINLRNRQANASGSTLISGDYSKACSYPPEHFRAILDSSAEIFSLARRPIEDANDQQIYDVIVTDPPYGFNTEDKVESLANLYRKAIASMIMSLRDGGQLVFAVPDWSHIGRHLPAFAQRDFITHQVLVVSERLGREVFSTAAQAPRSSQLMNPPYYWESERALRRAILHFRFRIRPDYKCCKLPVDNK